MTMKKNIVIFEYNYIFIGSSDYEKNIAVDKKTFDEIEAFVLQNSDHAQYLKLGQNKLHKFLQAQNYVGIIQTYSGVIIEILPKIARKLTGNFDNEKEGKNLLLKMLKTLRNSPFKTIKSANLKSENISLYEIFITMFLDELTTLVKKGIKSDYLKKEENLKFLRGKLNIREQIIKNSVNRENFFVEYDIFSNNRIENRIIKTTLDFLYKNSKSLKNKKKIREFNLIFDNIKPIHNYHSSFSKLQSNRQMITYELILKWCNIFLLNKSFTPYKGTDVAFALLFDMNMLFESYIGDYLKKKNAIMNIKLQDSKHHLAHIEEQGKFKLIPDIVIEQYDQTIICDTKWKILDSEPSQSDMYQLYAYGTKYDCKKLYLIYPYTFSSNTLKYNFFKSDPRLDLIVIYFDLHSNCFYREDEICFLTNV